MNLPKGLQCKWDPKTYENPFQRNKAQGKIIINNPTDKRIVLLERVNKSNNNWKVFTWGENSTTQKKREVLRSKINPEK